MSHTAIRILFLHFPWRGKHSSFSCHRRQRYGSNWARNDTKQFWISEAAQFTMTQRFRFWLLSKKKGAFQTLFATSGMNVFQTPICVRMVSVIIVVDINLGGKYGYSVLLQQNLLVLWFCLLCLCFKWNARKGTKNHFLSPPEKWCHPDRLHFPWTENPYWSWSHNCTWSFLTSATFWPFYVARLAEMTSMPFSVVFCWINLYSFRTVSLSGQIDHSEYNYLVIWSHSFLPQLRQCSAREGRFFLNYLFPFPLGTL